MDQSPSSPSAKQLDPLKEAMRADLLKILNGEIFDGGVLKNLIRKAKAAQQYLMADALIGIGGEILNEDLDPPSPGSGLMFNSPSALGLGGLGSALNSETFGAKVIREVFPMLENLERAKRDTPERLVEAIAAARENGLTDVAAALEKRLLGADAANLGAVETAPTVSRVGTPMDYAENVQPRNADQIAHPAVKAIAEEFTGKSLRELASDPDA